MPDLVLHNIPATPEGKAFIRQLRKYLPPEYKIRTRGNLKDRKAASGGDVRRHQLLRQNVPVYMADRLRVYVDEKPAQFLNKRNHQWYYTPTTRAEEMGPFRTYKAALAAKRITEGT